MIISKDNLKNPYVLAFCKAHGVKQGYPDDFMEYYDVQKNEMYMADCVLLQQGIIKWKLEEDWLKE